MADAQPDSDVTPEDIGTEMSSGQVSALAKVNALRPNITEFADKPGYYVEENGTAHYPFIMNHGDGRGPTKAAQELAESLQPFNRASKHYQMSTAAVMPQVMMVDRNGNKQRMDPIVAETSGRAAGFKPYWKPGGIPVERGQLGDMLWRRMRGAWQPTGLRCLGTPLDGGSADYPCRGLVKDPDGVPYRGYGNGWQRMSDD